MTTPNENLKSVLAHFGVTKRQAPPEGFLTKFKIVKGNTYGLFIRA